MGSENLGSEPGLTSDSLGVAAEPKPIAVFEGNSEEEHEDLSSDEAILRRYEENEKKLAVESQEVGDDSYATASSRADEHHLERLAENDARFGTSSADRFRDRMKHRLAERSEFEVQSGSTSDLAMTDLIELVEPSVVRIDVKTDEGESAGSGFVVAKSGLIVTNYHVVEGAKSMTIRSRDGKEISPEGFVVAEPKFDLCVLLVDPDRFACVPIAMASEPPRKGESVAAFGSPLGFSFSATNGIVSAYRTGQEVKEALSRSSFDAYEALGYSPDTHWVQTSAAISGGNSGGPLVNMRGEVIGVNTFTSSIGQNLNFAIAKNKVVEVIERRGRLPRSIAQLPKKTSSSVVSGALTQIFGSEIIKPASIGSFEESDQKDSQTKCDATVAMTTQSWISPRLMMEST